MSSSPRILLQTVLHVANDLMTLIAMMMRSRAHLAAEKLFLQKQLALYLAQQVKARRADNATRDTLISLTAYEHAQGRSTTGKPETLMRWHRKGFRLFWRWKSSGPCRPPIPADLRQLIVTMAIANRTWGEERIAAELLVKLGIRVSARTVRWYMPSRPHRG